MTDDAATPAPAPVKELWAFAGHRVGVKNLATQVWVDDEGKGKELWFAKKGVYSIGGIYEVETTRHADGRLTLHGGSPRFIRASDDRDARTLWEAENLAANAILESKRRERKADADSALNEALAPLVTIAKGLRTNAQRDVFAAHIIRKIAESAW